ncbi:MAG TPA: hypothetical protein VNG51_04235 [Ktedonobacteraceae bacterium]|nr:hypothetical protein [Ktedonobacteraceae bacterium]
MNWRSPRFLILYLIVFLALVIGVGVVIIYLRSTSTDITIVWQTSPTSFAQQDRQGIQNAWEADLTAPSSSPGTITNHTFTIITAHRQGDWAIFSANERVNPNGQPIPTEPLFFLAHLQDGNWVVWIPSSAGFCQELNQVPDTLLDSGDKHYFLGCYQ